MKSFTLEIVEGRPLMCDGDEVVMIYTGWPTTLQARREMSFLGRRINCFSTMAGVTLPKMSELLGKEITALLGMDILSSCDLFLDYHSLEAIFSREPMDFEGQSVGMRHFMGMPIIDVIVGGKLRSVYVDTGSNLSFLSQDIMNIELEDQLSQDFFPEVGIFKTKTLKLETKIGSEKIEITYGVLPIHLNRAMSAVGVDGIIGYDFFSNHKVLISPSRGELRFKPVDS